MTGLIFPILEAQVERIATAIEMRYDYQEAGSFHLGDRTCRYLGETQPSGGVVGPVANGIG